jgi:short-subunit dehydrogenase
MASSSTRQLALVTGGSSGIGFELARQFVEHDFDVLIAAEDPDIHSAAQELQSHGATVEAVQVDLATREGVEQLYERVKELGRPLDAAALNAGVGVGGPFIDTDLDEELRLINLNVSGVVQLSKLLLQDMVSRGEGRVLYTSSIAADLPAPFMAVYGASKAFELSFAEALRNELKDTGVSITALQPGPTETNFFDRAGMEDTKVASDKKSDPADVAREGFEALMSGKDHVVAGLKNKVQDLAAQVMPEPAKAAAHRKLTEPGSAHK